MTSSSESTQNGSKTAPLAPALGQYVVPTKHILSKAHLEAFNRSPAHDAIMGFIDALNASIVGRKLSECPQPNDVSLYPV